jgi:hypothetical protein
MTLRAPWGGRRGDADGDAQFEAASKAMKSFVGSWMDGVIRNLEAHRFFQTEFKIHTSMLGCWRAHISL